MATIKKILVTGSSGFLGYNFINKVIKKNYKVFCIYNKKIKKINKAHYIKCNLENYNDVKKKLRDLKFDYVVNLSGYGDHSDIDHGGDKIINNHYIISMNLVKFFINKKIIKYINIGSSDEYGKNRSPQKEFYKEDPNSPYAFAKTINSILFQMLYKNYKFPSVTLRPFLVYGPYQETNRLIPFVIKSCLNNKTFDLTSGNQYRDFCYVDDFCDAIIKSFNNKKINGKILNISSGKKTQIKKIVKIIQQKIKKGKPRFGNKKLRKNENKSLYADITIAKKLLNWKTKTNINEGLDLTIKFFKENE